MPSAAATREKSRRFYDLSVRLSGMAKVMFGRSDLQALEDTLGAYIKLTKEQIDQPTDENPNPDNTVEVETEILQQMALLAAGPLARLISQRYKLKTDGN